MVRSGSKIFINMLDNEYDDDVFDYFEFDDDDVFDDIDEDEFVVFE